MSDNILEVDNYIICVIDYERALTCNGVYKIDELYEDGVGIKDDDGAPNFLYHHEYEILLH